MSPLSSLEAIASPNFSEDDIAILKKYFEINKRYYAKVNAELTPVLSNHPVFGPLMKLYTPEQTKAQSEHSIEMQRAAIYDGKWEEYSSNLIAQGRTYARMNVAYADWYDVIRMYKVYLLPHIKRDFADSVADAVDFIDGLTKFLDYAMYGIAEAYFQEKNMIILENEERFRTIFENSADHIILLDSNGTIEMINHVVKGRVKEEILGKCIYDLQQPQNENMVRNAIDKVFSEKIPVTYETDSEIDGEKKYFASTASPVFNKERTVRAAVVIARDITHKKLSEAKVHELNATLEMKVLARTEELKRINQELESFSYSISHDLRGPLRAISGFTQILAEEIPSDLNDDAKDAMEEIISNAARMGRLIDDLLEFSRLGKQQLSKVNVNMDELVGSVIADLKKTIIGPEVKIKVNQLGIIQGDYGMLKQVVINLISNAIKYSGRKSVQEIEIGSSTNGSAFYIKDNGAGFDMAYYDKLFGVFQRLHRNDEFEGTGVGLAIAQRIITRHGGKIWAEGKVNQGATFSFSLPNS